MAIAYPMTKIRNTRFNHFWYSHHLLLLMLVMLCFHGTKCMLEPFQSVYWLMVPMMCYLVPRLLRETELSECSVLSVANQKGNVVRIRLAKPKSWEKQMHAGMYAYINVPQVSRLEWHPFTMTSSPSDSYIEFHVRRAGDWTGKLHDLLQEYKAAELGKVEMNRGSNATERDDSDPEFTESSTSPAPIKLYTRLSDLVIKVEGPIGAPSQGYSNFPIVVLVAAGIGVTPMISVLKELLDKPGKMKRVFFYWTVRDRESFEWFGSLMQDIYDEAYDHNEEHHIVMHIRPFLTSARQDDQDLGAVLLRCARKGTKKI
jgi:predicted ferric reductase